MLCMLFTVSVPNIAAPRQECVFLVSCDKSSLFHSKRGTFLFLSP